jgi:hypothetical protein
MIRAGAQRDSGAQRYGDPGAERVRPSAAAGGAQRYGSQRRAALWRPFTQQVAEETGSPSRRAEGGWIRTRPP